MRKLITILLVLLSFGAPLRAGSFPPELAKALARGDSEKLSEFFLQSLELTILDKEYMVSRNQATRIMQSFFRDNPPSSFTISFEGDKEKSRYAIGKLKSANGDFRVNIFFMSSEGKDLVYFLSIKKESQYELYP